jgi:DNA-binding response OmpR family regulator
MAELVSDMLTSSSAEAQVFTVGTDLLKCVERQNFKAIILDLSLPDIDGFDIMDMIAAEYIGMSLVLLSGHDLATMRAARFTATASA